MLHDMRELSINYDKAMDDLAAGYWMHAKGGIYVVNYVGVCSETKEIRVLYSEVEETGRRVPDVPIWDRPYAMWHELVEAPSGLVVARFERIAGGPGCVSSMREARGVQK